MDNSAFVDEENIPMVHDEEDYDERYDTPNASRVDETTPNASRVDETSFIEDTTELTSTLRLRQKVKQDKLTHCTGT